MELPAGIMSIVNQAVVPKAAQIRSRWRPHSRYMNHNADIYRKLRAMS
jgi:hypothetical protein